MAQADDASNGIMLAGLMSKPLNGVRVVSSRVLLHAEQITVSMTADVDSVGSAHITMAGPRFGWQGEAEPYPDRQFPELRVFADGTPAHMTSAFSAFVGATDITATLRASMLDPFAIAEAPPFVSPVAGHAAAFHRLVALGAIEVADDGDLAQWTAARTVDITLGSTGQHTLALTYKARPAYALLPRNRLSTLVPLMSYCLSASKLAALLGKSPSHDGLLVRQYAIPMGIDDKASANVQVQVTASHTPRARRALVAFCGSDHQTTTGWTADVSGPAQTDSNGVLHILTIGRAH